MKEKFVAFLRGINVGGHHKVPMAELRKELEKLGCKNIVTLLNSGNIIFDAISSDLAGLEKTVSEHLESSFGFPVPVILRRSEIIRSSIIEQPFKDVTLTKDIRLYVSFLRDEIQTDLILPWTSTDKSFTIIDIKDNAIFSVLDLSTTKTPKAMVSLERYFGKDITTRNWNTIERIGKVLNGLV